MADPLVSVMFDAAALAMGVNLRNFAPFLDPQMTLAMHKIAVLVQDTAVANTWTAFANPTGALANSIMGVVVGPLEMDLQVNVPYAWRMEEGFKGTDSIGRTYDEEGKPYAMPAIVSNEAAIMQFVGLATAEAFAKAGGK